ncbi:MAG: glycerophosphodiester phosphodiesterase family protein [Verrucomicrobiales bacterium]|nr:glycerophosphodiester phosphodiesterase family protein [Verrucomicrobiales bacterium]
MRAIILTVGTLLLLCSAVGEDSGRGSRYVSIAAHRGGYGNDLEDSAPENTLANLEVAIRKGFDVYETDIRRTRDGVFVIVHDDVLDRETTGSGPVEELSIEEVKALKKRYRNGSASESQVATLEELLRAGKGRIRFKPDLKPGVIDSFDELAQLIHDLGMEKEVLIRTGLKDAAKISKAYAAGAPKIQIMFKVDRVDQVQRVVREFSPSTIQVNVEKEEALSAGKREAIQEAVRLGLVVETHSYSDFSQLSDLIQAGVRMVHTANPDATLTWLQKEGWR